LFEPDTINLMVAVPDPSTDPPVNVLPDPKSVIVVYDKRPLVVLPVQCELITLILGNGRGKGKGKSRNPKADTWKVTQASPKRAVVILLSI